MRFKSHIVPSVTLCLLGLLSPLVSAAEPPAQPLPTAQLVAVEGASITYRLIDYDKRVVEVVVPSHARADIWRSKSDSTVEATLASLDSRTNRVKVVTQMGQILVLEMAHELLKGIPIGDTFTLVVPRRAEIMAYR